VIAVHEWPPEDQITVTKEMIAGFNDLIKGTAPEGIELCYTWARTDIGAFCLWNVPRARLCRPCATVLLVLPAMPV